MTAEAPGKRSRAGMGFRSDGSPIVAPGLWRSVLRRFLRRPEPVAGIPGEGSGAGEHSAPAPTLGPWNLIRAVPRPFEVATCSWPVPKFDPIPVDVPARSILFPKEGEGVGIPCATCGRRGTVRIKPRIYGCRNCLGLSLVAIGRMGTCGFAVYELRETPAEAAALQAAISRGTVER